MTKKRGGKKNQKTRGGSRETFCGREALLKRRRARRGRMPKNSWDQKDEAQAPKKRGGGRKMMGQKPAWGFKSQRLRGKRQGQTMGMLEGKAIAAKHHQSNTRRSTWEGCTRKKKWPKGTPQGMEKQKPNY